MSRIVTEVYDAFRAANVDENLARAAAGAIADREELVTKLDLERAVGGLKSDLNLVKFGYGPTIIGLLVKLVFFP